MPCPRVEFPPSLVDALPRGLLEPIHVRPVHPSDGERIAELVRSLSQTSRYQRFHVGLHELPPPMVQRFVRVDNERELALVATICAGGREVAVAEARHAASDDEASTHEFGLVVHDDFRGAGLGERMLRRLMRHAREHGLRWLVGDVLSDNRAMLGLAAKLGFTARRLAGNATLTRVTFRLAGA